jgi:mono/diheme cytochrome c family protein
MRSALVLALVLSVATGCGAALTARDPSFSKTNASAVDWNPSHADVGHVAAVAELGDEVDVFSDAGLFVFVSGSLVGSDASVKRWRGAATIPASGGAGRWVVGFDDAGNVWRVKDRSHLEAVTDRFALPKKTVLSAFGGGSGAAPVAGFLLDDQLALADGKLVRFVPAHARSAAGGGTVVALREDDRLTKLALDLKTAAVYRLPAASELAVDAQGHLYAAREDSVYAEQGKDLVLVYRASSGKIHGLAASGDRVWLAEGDTLATIDASSGGGQRVATVAAPPVGAAARLFGSPSGDVWVLDGGRLSRYSVGHAPGPAATAPSDDAAWQATVRPVFLRVCASCHGPNGSSGVDLSSAAAWRSSRAEIKKRVVDAKSMPPVDAPHPLTEADRSALAGWLGR